MNNIFQILKKDRRLKKGCEDAARVAKIHTHWDQIFSKLSEDLSFYGYNKGILTIETKNSCWMSEIQHFKPMILAKLNKILGNGQVRTIKVRLRGEAGDAQPAKLRSGGKGRTFLEKIQWSQKEKKDQGMTLCSSCNAMWTWKNRCVFCKNKFK